MVDPPIWSTDELEEERNKAIRTFRRERLEEPLESYLASFDEYRGAIEELLSTSIDLSQLEQRAYEILSDPRLLQAFRYLAGPPISADDLKTLAEASSLNALWLKKRPDLVSEIVRVVTTCLDRRRFAWVLENRPPTESEKNAAILASAALLATQRVGTKRRHLGKRTQEELVANVLVKQGFRRVSTRAIDTLAHAPDPGEFCGESILGTRKADFVVRLWDARVMPIECKVSNSAINSVKRLNNDAAVKAVAWTSDFGRRQIIPVAVLSGVFKLRNLIEAQERGLTIFWAHALERLAGWSGDAK